jgi:hypothetical protein
MVAYPVVPLLSRTQYAPAVDPSYTTTSATPAAVDTTNMTFSFVAPASGDVLIRLSASIYISSGILYFCLFTHNTLTQVGDTMLAGSVAATTSAATATILTGLTPGQTYQLDWGFFCVSPGAAVISAIGAQGAPGTNGGPAVMEVWSA